MNNETNMTETYTWKCSNIVSHFEKYMSEISYYYAIYWLYFEIYFSNTSRQKNLKNISLICFMLREIFNQNFAI